MNAPLYAPLYDCLSLVLRATLIGIGATVVMDFWSLVAARAFGFPPPNFAMVGRWIGHMAKGRFVHEAIARATPIPGEQGLGWIVHYVTGIAFAGLLVAIYGAAWTREPTPLPALLIGLATLVFPFFLMQPAMGAGIASARAPNPNAARLRSVLNHAAFGAGLFLSAYLVALFSAL